MFGKISSVIKKRCMSLESIFCSLGSGRGFTLVELLVVVVILGIISSIVYQQVTQRIDETKWKGAKTQIAVFANTLEVFKLDNGRYPTSEEGLKCLRHDPGLENWNGPYIPKEVPKDPWGNEYIYKSPGEVNASSYDLLSYGADNKPGGDKWSKDIFSWED
jgi:general secretion pathway protein G